MKRSSLAAAREKYGVAFTGTLENYDLEVDAAANAGAETETAGGESPASRVRSRPLGYRVGIDIGGTFTDFALLRGSEVVLHKNLSTPEDRSLGVMTGLDKLAQLEGMTLSDFLGQCDAIVHATTIADNTLIEHERRSDRPDHH